MSMVSPAITSRPESPHLNTPLVSPGLQHVTDKAVVKLYRKPLQTSVPLPQCFALQLLRRPIYGC